MLPKSLPKIFPRSWQRLLSIVLVIILMWYIKAAFFDLPLIEKSLDLEAYQRKFKSLIGQEVKKYQQIKSKLKPKKISTLGEFKIVNDFLSDPSQNDYLDSNEVGLVLHCTADDIHEVQRHMAIWNGPMSVAVFCTGGGIDSVVTSIMTLRKCSDMVRQHATFSLVLPVTDMAFLNFQRADDANLACDRPKDNLPKTLPKSSFGYPINAVRKAGVANSKTKYDIVLDIDVFVAQEFKKKFLQVSKHKSFLQDSSNDKTVYVLPIFELMEGQAHPRNKTELLELQAMGSIWPLVEESCAQCHASTDYQRWMDLPVNGPLEIAYFVNYSLPWQPFYVSKKSVPKYDEVFRELTYDRISQVCATHLSGHNFAVLNDGFLIHERKPEKASKNRSVSKLERNKKLFHSFQLKYMRKYKKLNRKCSFNNSK